MTLSIFYSLELFYRLLRQRFLPFAKTVPLQNKQTKQNKNYEKKWKKKTTLKENNSYSLCFKLLSFHLFNDFYCPIVDLNLSIRIY